MTKRRPSNKKPTGLNKTLGNALSNQRGQTRKAHKQAKYDGEDFENPAFLEEEAKHFIDSVTDETSLEEFLAKAQLAGTEFTAEREHFRVIEKDTRVVIPTRLDLKDNLELQGQYAHRLRIPRRPSRELWSTVEELTKLENENFLQWRNDLAELQEVNGLALTPFERNPDMWRELWRVIEKSDIIVQIVDARNPLLFRSKDLDDYVKEVDAAKQVLLMVNKADLLSQEQMESWHKYFKDNNIAVVFWSALETAEVIPEENEDCNEGMDDGMSAEPSNITAEQPANSASDSDVVFLNNREDLITFLKKLGHVSNEIGSRPLMVGMVGYPNVGKSSTINKLAGSKKVSVSATPGKTRHFQTIHLDNQLCLCDCPGLVMPSFAFGRDEMFLNGILPPDQMRDHFRPTALLLSRIPSRHLEESYSMMLPEGDDASPVNLLTAIAFVRGFMSASGIPDCSRSARMLIKDVVSGKIRWVSPPPGTDAVEFNPDVHRSDDTHRSGQVALEQMQKRGLLDGQTRAAQQMDVRFFGSTSTGVHTKDAKTNFDVLTAGTVIPDSTSERGNKKHYNRNKKEKIRRLYVQTY